MHARYALIHWLILDFLTFSFQALGRRGIGSPRGGSIYASADSAVHCLQQLLPSLFETSHAATIAWLIRQLHIVFVHFATGMAFYQGLCFGYHLAAVGGLLIFRQDAGQWPRLMQQPLMADSILQFWGKRWHQVSLYWTLHESRLIIFQIFRVRLRLLRHLGTADMTFFAASIRRALPSPAQALSIPREPHHRIQHLLTHARNGHAHHGRRHLAVLPRHPRLPIVRSGHDRRNRLQATHGPTRPWMGRQDLVLDVCRCVRAGACRCVVGIRCGWGEAFAGVDEHLAAGR